MRDLYKKEVLRDLKNLNNLSESIKNLEDKLFEVDQELKNVQALNYDGMPKGQGKKIHTRTEQLILDKDTIQSKIDRTNKRIYILKNCLEQLQDIERYIIEDLIINQKNVDVMCTTRAISKSEAYRIKDEALYNLSIKLFGIDAL